MMDCVFVILGAGDLTKKKLVPAINKISGKNRVAVVIASREKKNPVKSMKGFYYFQLDFYDRKRFMELEKFVEDVEKKHRLSGNRLFYLATLPQHFDVIARSISKCRLAERRKGLWRRVVFEKPFGQDLKSARSINKSIKMMFNEDQVYRIDHYLGKELVQNMAIMRFTNIIFQPLWNRKFIDNVQIIMSEDIGAEKRSAFYDKYGALKDVVQNHVMQLLALTAMESPKFLTEKHIRNQKVRVLRSARINPANVVLGQYKGYRKEKGVKKGSRTETFAALKLSINNSRWKGVPFYIMAGKNLAKKKTAINIEFKQAKCLMFRNVCTFVPNHLTVDVQPEMGFHLHVNTKVPARTDITSVKMDFCHACEFGPHSPEAYETLLLDVMKGDQSVFIRSDEIEQQWRIIDLIAKKRHSIVEYRKGNYPKEADRLIQKDSRYWRINKS